MIVPDEEGYLSASINATPLEEVLQAFSSATGVEVEVTGRADESITVSFEELAPEEAIRAILGPRGAIGFYTRPEGSRDPSARKLTTLWIFRGIARPVKSSPRRPARRSPARTNPFEALKRQALTDKNPDRRRRAIEALIQTDEKKAKAALVQALLNDKDPEVRQAALENLLWYDEEAPRQALIRAALRDASPAIRRQAIEEVFVDEAEDDRSARRVLVQALGDKDAEIRMSVIEALSSVALYDEADRSVRQALVRAARDRDEKVRLAAIEGLEDNEMRGELQALVTSDASDGVRTMAQEALERLGTE